MSGQNASALANAAVVLPVELNTKPRTPHACMYARATIAIGSLALPVGWPPSHLA